LKKLALFALVFWVAGVGGLMAIGVEGLKLGFFSGALGVTALTILGVKAFLQHGDDDSE